MDLGVSDRVYFVTGGSRGIGRATVELLLTEGAMVSTCARGSLALRELATAWADEAERLLVTAADVRDEFAVARSVAATVERFGRLDGLILNAGSGIVGRPLDTPYPLWADQFEIKIAGALHVVAAAAPHLRHSDAARVVIINATTGRVPDPDMAAVSASRAALDSFMRTMGMDLVNEGILVNAVNVGVIATDRQRDRYSTSGTHDSFETWSDQEAHKRRVPLGRMGRPEEVAPAVAFLVSPLASYISGSCLDVAGGGVWGA